jgi:hypothetical protein
MMYVVGKRLIEGNAGWRFSIKPSKVFSKAVHTLITANTSVAPDPLKGDSDVAGSFSISASHGSDQLGIDGGGLRTCHPPKCIKAIAKDEGIIKGVGGAKPGKLNKTDPESV